MTSKINKSFLKRLKGLSNKELSWKAQAFKLQNRVIDSPVTQSKSFQRNYDTLLFEAERRGMLK